VAVSAAGLQAAVVSAAGPRAAVSVAAAAEGDEAVEVAVGATAAVADDPAPHRSGIPRRRSDRTSSIGAHWANPSG
jgi:hypothetical protein